MCCEGWQYPDAEVDGECPDCGMPTVDGEAQYGCDHSPLNCSTCGSRLCDESC